MLRVMSDAELETLDRLAEAQKEVVRLERELSELGERESYRARRTAQLRLVHSERAPSQAARGRAAGTGRG